MATVNTRLFRFTAQTVFPFAPSSSFFKMLQRESDGRLECNPVGGVEAAILGSLSARTDDNTGEVTLASAHDITFTQKVDVYWNNGLNVRYGMYTSSVVGQVLSLDGGVGDVLPLSGTAVKARRPKEVEFKMSSENLVALYVRSPSRGRVVFYDLSNTQIMVAEILPTELGQYVYAWVTDNGPPNPLDGAVVGKLSFSHGELINQRMNVTAFYINPTLIVPEEYNLITNDSSILITNDGDEIVYNH